MEVHIMNKKVLSLGVMLSLATTGAMAADVVTTSVNNGDQLSKYQKEAIQLTQKQLAEKSVQDSKTYESKLDLDESRTIDLALANNRTAKQTKWGYEAAKSAVSQVAAAKNPSVSYGWSAQKTGGDTGRGKSGSHNFSISAPVFNPQLDASIDSARYTREGTGASYEEALQQAKYDAISGYYTLIMNRNLVDVAQQAVKDYQGHVTNVQAQYNVGLVASSDVLAAKTNLADSETNLVKAQNVANLAEASLNQVIAYPVQTAINTAEHDLQYKPYNVTLEQAKAYALLHRSALVKSALDVKSAKSGYLPTVAVKAGRGYADLDGYFGTSTKSWSVGATASWSLWDGGATQNAIKKANAQLEQAKEANLATVDAVLLAVQKAYLNLRSAEQTIQSTQTAVAQGQESFRIATLRYRAGVGTNLDVLDAETKLTDARNNYVQALYNYNISIAALEQLTGVPLNTPVGQGAGIIANSGAAEQLAQLGGNQ